MLIKHITNIINSLYNGYEMLARSCAKIYNNLIGNHNQSYKPNCLILCIMLLLAGCNVGDTNNTPEIQNTSTSSPYIQIANIATIPYTNYIHSEYTPVIIANNLNKNIMLQKVKIIANGQILAATATASHIDLNNCLQIKKNSRCQAKVLTNPNFQSYLLNLIFSDIAGNSYSVNQIISFNALLPIQNGFIYDTTQLNLNQAGLTIPFRLASTYSKINVLVNGNQVKFSCYQNNYNTNTLCNAYISNSDLYKASKSSMYKFQIIGYDNMGATKSSANPILILTNTQAANIITSGQNVVISPDDGSNPQTVFLVNNGLTSAIGLTITPQNPITISSNTCTNTLAANANCSFAINVSGSVTSGQSNVGVTYFNGQNNQQINFNVSYISPNPAPGLTLTASGNFNNIQQSTEPIYLTVNVTNTGTTSLANLQFNNLNLQNSNMSSYVAGSTCYNGMNLNTGVGCNMILNYNSSIAESGSVNFIPIGTYSGPAGESWTYANSILNLAYSSVTAPSFVTVGDFGTVFSSTTTPPTTWTTNINSPFNSLTESANGIAINGSTYAITMNSGRVIYSSNYGLFWQNATSTNLSSSQCEIIFDGTNYYTCGVASITSGLCTSGNGCIIYTPNIGFSSWSIAAGGNTLLGTDVTKIAYFSDNLGNTAYLAGPVRATAYSGNRISLSISGTSGWTTVGGGQTGQPGIPVVAFAFNPNSGYITGWLANGHNSSALITALVSNWSCCTNLVTAPGASNTTGVVYSNGLYYVSTTSGNVYLISNPQNPPGLNYTTIYTGSTQLNKIAYGNNEIMAIGNSGSVVESFSGSGFSAKANLAIGQNTLPNLQSVYFESVNNNFWVTGVNTIAYTPVAATPVWTTPGLRDITKYVSNNINNYLALDTQGFIYTSTNLTSWTQQTNPSNQILNSIYCGESRLCLAVGNNGAIIKSVNGTSWNQLTSPTTNTLNGITCQFGICVGVGGAGAANSGTALVSNNNGYNSWTLATSSLATTILNAIATLLYQFVAVGNSGTIFISTNGVDWLAESSGTINNLNSIACSNFNCVAVGNGGTIIVSNSDLTSWSAANSGTTNDLNSVIYNGIFVAVGKSGTMRYSTTGSGSWTTATFPSTITTTNLWALISK